MYVRALAKGSKVFKVMSTSVQMIERYLVYIFTSGALPRRADDRLGAVMAPLTEHVGT